MPLSIWLISQSANDNYDTFSDAVVIAETEERARLTHPDRNTKDWNGKARSYDDWTAAENVSAKLIGTALPDAKPGVVCASFHAG